MDITKAEFGMSGVLDLDVLSKLYEFHYDVTFLIIEKIIGYSQDYQNNPFA